MEKKEKIKSKKKNFWFGFRIYMGVLVFLLVVLLIYVWNTMKKFEKSQSQYIIEELVTDLEKGKIDSLSSNTGSKFEKVDDAADLFLANIKGKDLTYKTDNDSYDSKAPIYDIVADDKTVAKVTLKEVKSYKKMAILSMSDWKIDSVQAELGEGNNNVKVTCPENYKVYVNDVLLGDDEMTGKATDMKGFEYVSEYVKAPKTVTYAVAGLFNKPSLKITDASGTEADLSQYSDYSDVSIGYTGSEIPKDLKDYVIAAAKDYSNFFSRDLEGSEKSTASLQKYFPDNSYYIQMAEMYRQGDMWMFSAHQTPVFSDVKVTDYISYSDECFSCIVSFNKSMILKNGQTRVDVNNQTYYYVKVNGSWLIADIKDNSK